MRAAAICAAIPAALQCARGAARRIRVGLKPPQMRGLRLEVGLEKLIAIGQTMEAVWKSPRREPGWASDPDFPQPTVVSAPGSLARKAETQRRTASALPVMQVLHSREVWQPRGREIGRSLTHRRCPAYSLPFVPRNDCCRQIGPHTPSRRRPAVLSANHRSRLASLDCQGPMVLPAGNGSASFSCRCPPVVSAGIYGIAEHDTARLARGLHLQFLTLARTSRTQGTI